MRQVKTPGRSAPAFFDEEAEKFLSFSEIISRYRPLSVFGKKIFSEIGPLFAEELGRHFEFLSLVRKCTDLRPRIEHILEDFHEISESMRLVGTNQATQVDLFEIKRFIHHHRMLKDLMERRSVVLLEDLNDLWKLLDPQESASYVFSPQSEEIRRISSLLRSVETGISALYRRRMERIEEMFGMRPKDRRFVVDRKKAMDIVDSDLVMVEREGIRSYTLAIRPTEEIIVLESKLSDLEDELHEARNAEISRLSRILSGHLERLGAEIGKIAEFDLAFSQLRSLEDGWTFPRFSSAVELEESFHPVIAQAVKNDGFEYTPLTGRFENGLTMIFGPNMGGKTSVLKTVGIVCALAMHGFPVPAKFSVLPAIDWVRYIGVTSGTVSLSSFAAQMSETAGAMALEGRGLILIDEFGSGTNPYEGEALAAALGSTLAKSNNFSVMVTHFRKAIETVDCRKYTMGKLDLTGEVTAQNIRSRIDHRLSDGAQTTSGDAVKLAKALGLPEEVIELAEDLLEDQ